MCVRYTLDDMPEVVNVFEIRDQKLQELQDFANYNVAPTQTMPIITAEEGARKLEMMKWGLVPSWSKEPMTKYSTFNARGEDIFSKPTWRGPARHHRCLVPATGFYEWVERSGAKVPFFIHPKDQGHFAFAGLYDEWGEGLLTYTIVTTTPNQEMQPIHNRMPVILHPDEWDAWLDPSLEDAREVGQLIHPYDDGKLEIYEVSPEVNSVRNNSPQLLKPVNWP